MLRSLFLNWLAGMVGGRFDKHKRKIGGVMLLLAGTCQVLMAFFPDLQVEGMSQVDWDATFTMFRDGFAALGGAFVAVGAVHSAYKEGLKQPGPPEVCSPTNGVKQDTPITNAGRVEVKDKWEGKPPSGSFQP
jgi:hypothetical protein